MQSPHLKDRRVSVPDLSPALCGSSVPCPGSGARPGGAGTSAAEVLTSLLRLGSEEPPRRFQMEDTGSVLYAELLLVTDQQYNQRELFPAITYVEAALPREGDSRG